MGILLDIVILAILILSVIMGYKKGLIGVIFSLCAFLVALILTWILYVPISNGIIQNTNIDENIKSIIVENGMIEEKNTQDKQNNKINEYVQKYITAPITDTANNAIEESAEVISEKVVAIGVAIILFLVLRIALLLLKFVAGGIASLPIIKQCNKAGGIVYGAIRGFFIIYIILAILFFVMSVNNAGIIAEAINSSIISKYLYANNIILNIIF